MPDRGGGTNTVADMDGVGVSSTLKPQQVLILHITRGRIGRRTREMACVRSLRVDVISQVRGMTVWLDTREGQEGNVQCRGAGVVRVWVAMGAMKR